VFSEKETSRRVDDYVGGFSVEEDSRSGWRLVEINVSNNFCGVAEMVGPVDFRANFFFWEWKDKFPVKWHMIKDVPFSQILHITLESNENRSIIFSRDTQQVNKWFVIFIL
jgi:hypothetical protein